MAASDMGASSIDFPRSNPAGRVYHIYCDESCTEKGNEFMVLAGIMLPAELDAKLKESIAQWRERKNMRRELKWERVSSDKYDEYREFVAGTFRYIKDRAISFRCMLLETRQIDYKGYHEGDRELGFYKFLFQLLYHSFLRNLYQGDRAIIHPDERSSSYRLSDLKRALNAKALNEMGWMPVSNIEPVDSKKSDIAQMNDVLMGAVGHQCNGREKVPGRRQAKVDLAAFVAEQAGLANLCEQTPRTMQNFGIWKFRLSAPKKRPEP